jgi:hypothetical protein
MHTLTDRLTFLFPWMHPLVHICRSPLVAALTDKQIEEMMKEFSDADDKKNDAILAKLEPALTGAKKVEESAKKAKAELSKETD